MGQFLSYLTARNDASATDLFLDLESAEPPAGDAESAVYKRVDEVLGRAKGHLSDLENYKGCGELIRKALTSPSKETEDAAWEAVLPHVDQQKAFFDYSLELEDVVFDLFKVLTVGEPEQRLSDQQALARQVALLFDFVLLFDERKMLCPHIQNDFSYYRRTVNRLKLPRDHEDVRMKDEVANRISLFFAYPTPMMKSLTDSTLKLLAEHKDVSRDTLTDVLSLMANVCESMVDKRKIQNDETVLFALRAMCGCIILYDHVSPSGSFHRKSPIAIKRCITLLKRHQPPQPGLLNALRYTTVHLNDKDTPTAITALLAN